MRISKINIDHVTIGGEDLCSLVRTFEGMGFNPIYGGKHSNGKTHMAIIPFSDGSYIELVSSIEKNYGIEEKYWWKKHIEKNGGPCGWAILSQNIEYDAVVVKQHDIAIKGPDYYCRYRPDGKLVEWELVFLEEKEPGATLPFLIQDKTDRSLRVPPSQDSHYITGIGKVILGVKELEKNIKKFQDVFGLKEPIIINNMEIKGNLAYFENTPIVLVEPMEKSTNLAKRIEKYGDCPFGYLIATNAIDKASKTLNQFNIPSKLLNKKILFHETWNMGDSILGLIEDDFNY